jgi:hypothetical protein
MRARNGRLFARQGERNFKISVIPVTARHEVFPMDFQQRLLDALRPEVPLSFKPLYFFGSFLGELFLGLRRFCRGWYYPASHGHTVACTLIQFEETDPAT